MTKPALTDPVPGAEALDSIVSKESRPFFEPEQLSEYRDDRGRPVSRDNNGTLESDTEDDDLHRCDSGAWAGILILENPPRTCGLSCPELRFVRSQRQERGSRQRIHFSHTLLWLRTGVRIKIYADYRQPAVRPVA